MALCVANNDAGTLVVVVVLVPKSWTKYPGDLELELGFAFDFVTSLRYL